MEALGTWVVAAGRRGKKKEYQIKESLDVFLFFFLMFFFKKAGRSRGSSRVFDSVVVFLNRPGRDFGKEIDWSWSCTSSSVESHDF